MALQNAGGLGSGNVVVTSGASLDLQNSITVSNPLTISGNGAGTAGQNGALASSTSGANNYQGVLTLGANATISSDSGTLNLNNGGAITGSGFTLTLAGAGNGFVSDGINTGSGGLIKNGSGTWTLEASASYTGSTTVNAGALTVASGLIQSSAVIVNGGTLNTGVGGLFVSSPSLTLGGGAFTFSGINAPSSYTETMGSLTLTPGTVSGITVNNENANHTNLTFSSTTFTRGADSILDITYTAGQGTGAAVTTSGVPSGSGAPTGTNNIFGYILVTDTNGITGLGQLNGSNQIVRFNSQTGASALTTSSNAANTDFTTFGTTYSSGLLNWTNGARSVNSLTIDTSTIGGSILLGGDPNSATAGVLAISSGALVFQGVNNSETIYGGQIGAANSELDIHQIATGTGTLTIGSVLTSGTGSVVKDGSGTLLLSGQSSQVGGLASSATVTGLGSTSNLYVGELVTGYGIGSGDYVASIVNGTSITLTSAATTTGNTTLTFGTQNSYSGGTYIDAGVLQAASAYSFSPNSPFILANAAGATLNLNGFNESVYTLSGGGALGGNVMLANGAVLTIGGGQTPALGGINQSYNVSQRASL